MYLHIGDDVSVRSDRIIGIFDIENSTVEEATRGFLKDAENKNRITYSSPKMPKSFILAEGAAGIDVYVSSVTVSAIRDRLNG
ncbi:MAG: DUF370 domain-containing protein [Clostridia bacterium]|nr:DUF370 domain-containing protein [Clostridia bacterium]MCR5694077.1 DUF370 domain-containing protein [Clostridia bacterium]